MITTTDILYKNVIWNDVTYLKGQVENIEKAMIAFAREAIKADRINLLEHVTITDIGNYHADGEYMAHFLVNKESLLNAPNIQLL